MRKIALILLLGLLIGGCASIKTLEAPNAYFAGKPLEAISQLDAASRHNARDRLLIHMEKGLIFHTLGAYRKSVRELRAAAELIDQQDYISLSRQAKTLAINEWAGTYKGEYSEHLWVHTWLMMDDLLLGDNESAAVEARQALKVLEVHGDALAQDYFTRALIALSFEAVGKMDDARIEARKLEQALPSTRHIAIRPTCPTAATNTSKRSDCGELILFVSQGRIVRKQPGDLFIAPDLRISFPIYPETFAASPRLQISDNGHTLSVTPITTHMDEVARSALDARAKSLMAKEIARVSLKQSMVSGLKKDNPKTADLLSAVFFLLEEADTRSWRTLPATISLVRIPLEAGRHEINISVIGAANNPDIMRHFNLQVHKGQKIYARIGANPPARSEEAEQTFQKKKQEDQ